MHMLHNPCYFWGLLLWLSFSVDTAISQTKQITAPLTQQIELRHDNDFFLLTDKYYTSGLFLTYRKRLEKGLFQNSHEQIALSLSQEVFTPSQTQSANSSNFDRPYAGFTGFTFSWSTAGEHQLFQINMALGLAGPNSGAGGFQRWYHRLIAISDSPLWTDELADSFHANLYTNYVKEWELVPVPFGVRFAFKPNLALGTRDIYIEPEAIFYFGRRNETNKTIAYDQLGSTDREIYFALHFSYRRVFYNGLIEGNLFGDDSIFTTEAENALYRLGVDFFHRYGRNNYKLGIRYNSTESPLAKNHKYVLLAYGLSF
ncbi:lipid A-modifier LpxR family protein [Maribacter sp. 2304DJ31-5]|uniref:lipid A-modifier LpxR family protein n=1 Tax=Maribacter sp. 2304DJ31-5 TaxID=3386273 RepID=UPI0039BD60DC